VVDCEYSNVARSAHLQGDVELVANVNAEGVVQRVTRKSGPEVLAEPAVKSLSKWLFAGCSQGTSGCDVRTVFTFILKGGARAAGQVCPHEFSVDLPDHATVTAAPLRAIVD
jgi:hypothetical protein